MGQRGCYTRHSRWQYKHTLLIAVLTCWDLTEAIYTAGIKAYILTTMADKHDACTMFVHFVLESRSGTSQIAGTGDVLLRTQRAHGLEVDCMRMENTPRVRVHGIGQRLTFRSSRMPAHFALVLRTGPVSRQGIWPKSRSVGERWAIERSERLKVSKQGVLIGPLEGPKLYQVDAQRTSVGHDSHWHLVRLPWRSWVDCPVHTGTFRIVETWWQLRCQIFWQIWQLSWQA